MLFQPYIDRLRFLLRSVSGHDDDGNAGRLLPHQTCQFHPIHAIHAIVGDQQVKGLALKSGQRVAAIVDAFRAIAVPAQNLASHPRQHCVVIHK